MVVVHQFTVASLTPLLMHNLTPHPRRLEEAGYGVGHRVLELLAFRDKQYKRETKLIGILQVRACVCGGVHGRMWWRWGGRGRSMSLLCVWTVTQSYDDPLFLSQHTPHIYMHTLSSFPRRCGRRSSTRWPTRWSGARRTRTSVSASCVGVSQFRLMRFLFWDDEATTFPLTYTTQT